MSDVGVNWNPASLDTALLTLGSTLHREAMVADRSRWEPGRSPEHTEDIKARQ